MKRLLTLLLTLTIFLTSVVQAEVSREQEFLKNLFNNLNSGMMQLNQIDENLVKDMKLSKFEKKLDKILRKIQIKNSKMIEHGSPDEIYDQYHNFKKTLLAENQDNYWESTFLSIEKTQSSTSLPEKEWLKKINSDEFREKFKNDILTEVRSSGSVHNYFKKIKQKLKALRSDQIDFPIEYVILSTLALMIIVGIFILIFFPIGGVAFIIGLSCIGTPMLFFLGLAIRQIIDPITCHSKQLVNFNNYKNLV
jgi:hypothetical protein